jgi:D-methionine transport system substrate-binding protein
MNRKMALCVLLFFAATTLFAGANKEHTDEPVIKIGIVGSDFIPTWEAVKATLAKENIKLELVQFSNYSIPNQALNDGDIDLNAFQHNAFLNAEIANRNFDLVPIGNTIISIMGVYSNKISNLNELKNGDTIAIPNDATNGGRALKALEAAGVIKVDPSKGHLPTIKDITENPLNIKIYEVEPSQVIRVLPDVAAGISNSNYVHDAGMNAFTDAIYIKPLDQEADKPYINVLVARTKDKDNPLYKKVLQTFQTKEIADVITVSLKGATFPAW